VPGTVDEAIPDRPGALALAPCPLPPARCSLPAAATRPWSALAPP
jgi:hypothetical protein